jgi:hypothetical protein
MNMCNIYCTIRNKHITEKIINMYCITKHIFTLQLAKIIKTIVI